MNTVSGIPNLDNAISSLYEFASKNKYPSPVFEFPPEEHKSLWPGGAKVFTARVQLNGLNVCGSGQGISKTIAKRNAAGNCWENIRAAQATANSNLTNKNPELTNSSDAPEVDCKILTASPRKRPVDADGSIADDEMPECDPNNPGLMLLRVLRTLEWVPFTYEEKVLDCVQNVREYLVRCYFGPPEDPKKYAIKGQARFMKEAKKDALRRAYAFLKDTDEIVQLWKLKTRKRLKGANPEDNVQVVEVVRADPSSDDELHDYLSSLPKANDPLQDMEARLLITLRHIKKFARNALTFYLGSETTGNEKSDGCFMETFTVLRVVARKLSTLNMEVKCEEEPDNDQGEKSVNVEISWKEEISGFPRQLVFPATASTSGQARNEAAFEFFLHFGIRDDEFQIPTLL